MAFAPAAQRSIARLLGRSRPAACPRLIIECNTTPQFPHSWATSSLLPLLPARTRAPVIRPFARRFQTTSASSSTSTQNEQSASREEAPAYEMTFTCKVCETRSTHRISKQGYHHGTVLIQCPGCKNRHLMADHLKIFSDTSITLEDIMKEKGQLVKKGALDAEGDLELWDDGTSTPRQTTPSTNETSTDTSGTKTP